MFYENDFFDRFREMTKTTQDRICWIDNIKGLCILLVFYNHHPDYVFPYSWLLTTAELVPFFVLSGFLHIKPLTGNFAKKNPDTLFRLWYNCLCSGCIICVSMEKHDCS